PATKSAFAYPVAKLTTIAAKTKTAFFIFIVARFVAFIMLFTHHAQYAAARFSKLQKSFKREAGLIEETK
ncbi:MAG: hypothetical protein RL069_755, partial [Planctomycetota bacterium]